MPRYKYVAKDLENRTQKGIIEASGTDDLYALLRTQNRVLLEYSEVEGKEPVSYRLKMLELSGFARQMSEMLGSGLTIVRALGILKERDAKSKLKAVYETLYRLIFNGLTLSEALRECNRAFPALFINMCVTGEASGQLEQTMRRMAEHYEKEHRLNTRVKSAMTYPMILGLMTVVVVLVIFIVVLPTLFDLFKDMELPAITQFLMDLSQFLINNWLYVLLGFFIVVAAVKYTLEIPAVRLAFDHFKLKMPIIGKLLKIIYTARFSRALSLLFSSGLPLINALQIAASLVNNKYIESQFPQVVREVREGNSLSDSLQKVDGFDGKLCTIVYVGEESGRLSNLLDSMSDSYDYEADMATTRLVSLIEPIMIIVMAVIIGSIMIAVMLPIYSMYSNIK